MILYCCDKGLVVSAKQRILVHFPCIELRIHVQGFFVILHVCPLYSIVFKIKLFLTLVNLFSLARKLGRNKLVAIPVEALSQVTALEIL